MFPSQVSPGPFSFSLLLAPPGPGFDYFDREIAIGIMMMILMETIILVTMHAVFIDLISSKHKSSATMVTLSNEVSVSLWQ